MASAATGPTQTDSESWLRFDRWSGRGWVLLAMLPFLASLVFATSEPAAEPLTSTRQQPSLQFATYLDFHDVQSRDLVPELVSVFRFRNTGSEPVQFGEIQRSCGCMSPELSTQTVAPGETGSLRVPILTAQQSPGQHEYLLTVNYTDPDPQQVTLSIKAVFPEQMVTLRQRALFLSQPSSLPIRHSFAIDDFRPQPLTVTEVQTGSSFVNASIGAITALPDGGATTEVQVEIAGDFPAGQHRFPVAVITDDAEFPVLTMPVFVTGPERSDETSVSVQPDTAVLVANSAQHRRKQIQVQLPADWSVSHLEAWPEELQVTYQAVSTSQPQQLLVVDISLPEPPSQQYSEGVVVLHANESRDLVTIPVILQWP